MRLLVEQRVVFDEQTVVLSSLCPDCGDTVPITTLVSVVVCECGGHQTVVTSPDMTDMVAHLWTHEGERE
jgi:hypothetical protein